MKASVQHRDEAMQRFLHHYRQGLPLKDSRYRSRLGLGGRLRFELLRLARPLWHPVKRFLEIVRCTRRWGGVARSASGVPAHRQFLQQVGLAIRHGVRPSDYYLYMLYRPELRAVADRFIYHHHMEVALKYLRQFVSAEDVAVAKSKIALYRFCLQNGIRTIPVLAVVKGRDVEWIESANERDIPDTGLFSKPDDMGEGKGARAWIHVERGIWSGSDGLRLDIQQVIESLIRQSVSLGRSILLQPRIPNHPAISEMIGSDSLCAARIITMRESDGTHAVVQAMLAIPYGESETSNFVPGSDNLGTPVDRDTGRLGPARSKDPATVTIEHMHHPETGVRIDGVVLPDWQEAVGLCLRAHAALIDLPFVGWDVAFTPTGPVLVEGNQGFGATSPQLTHLKPLGDTSFPELFDWHVRRLRAGLEQDS